MTHYQADSAPRSHLPTHEVENQPVPRGEADLWAEDPILRHHAGLSRADGGALAAYGALMGSEAMRAAGRAQLGILREAYPPIESEADYRRAERIDFYDLYAEGDWDCRLLPESQTLFQAEQRLILVKLRCEDAALSGAWSFHALIAEGL